MAKTLTRFLAHLLLGLLLLLWPWSVLQAGEHTPMLPQVYAEGDAVAGWWMSEKLDGVRGYWDGRLLWSKQGKLLQPPRAFVAGLPDFALEGELWGGRGSFERTAAVVRQLQSADWLQLQFAIFDAPTGSGPFSERIEQARRWFQDHPTPYAFVIEQIPVQDQAQLQAELQRVEAAGGEGLMVRNPQAHYAAGRSAEVLKVKSFADAEAVVIEHLPGQGENQGRLGALLVERPDGLRFRLGTGFSAAERLQPPPLGSSVSYKYYGLYPSGIPRFPAFLRLRQDQGM
ncbi:MAG: DNA ligase [Trichloromonadaceae bacterium]